MSVKIEASESLEWVADRLPEHQYRAMIEEMQNTMTEIAQRYGMDLSVCESFGYFGALRFKRN